MSICIIIDGMLMAGDPAGAVYCPEIGRMAAVGRGGSMDLGQDASHPERGLLHLDLLLGRETLPAALKKLPLGYLGALGMGFEPDPEKTWAALGLLHLFQKTNKLLFLSPERVGLQPAEKKALIACLQEELQHQGWNLHWSDVWGGAVISSEQELLVDSAHIGILEGESFFEQLPQGLNANTMLALITTGQMLLVRDKTNLEREKKQLLPLNSPWLWGVGRGDTQQFAKLGDLNRGNIWSKDAVVAGLGRMAGLQPEYLDEQHGFTEELIEKATQVSAQGKRVVLHLQSPAQLARMGMLEARQERLTQIDRQLIAPLASRLAEQGGKVVITTTTLLDAEGKSTTGVVPWLVAEGAALERKKNFWRFWQKRALGEGERITVKKLREECSL